MLRIAVPNKGSLSEAAAEMLREAGYRSAATPRSSSLTDAENDVEFFYLRPRDIALYVGAGTVDFGITGRDLLLDSGAAADEVLTLGFGALDLPVCRPARHVRAASPRSPGHRVATSYPGLVEKHLADHGVAAQVVRLDGAVETAITLGVADVIADVVETGTTLRQQGLEVFGEPILRSEAVLIRREGSARDGRGRGAAPPAQGVLVARHYVMMDYDVPVDLVDGACALTPGLESPTVSPLQNKGWVAVRAMVPAARDQRDHGRALRPRRPGHPRHRHPRLPALTEP